MYISFYSLLTFSMLAVIELLVLSFVPSESGAKSPCKWGSDSDICIFSLHPDASILHLSGGLHNYRDGLNLKFAGVYFGSSLIFAFTGDY